MTGICHDYSIPCPDGQESYRGGKSNLQYYYCSDSGHSQDNTRRSFSILYSSLLSLQSEGAISFNPFNIHRTKRPLWQPGQIKKWSTACESSTPPKVIRPCRNDCVIDLSYVIISTKCIPQISNRLCRILIESFYCCAIRKIVPYLYVTAYPSTTHYESPSLLIYEYSFECLQVAVEIIRLQIAGFSPLVPAMNSNQRRLLCVAVSIIPCHSKSPFNVFRSTVFIIPGRNSLNRGLASQPTLT